MAKALFILLLSFMVFPIASVEALEIGQKAPAFQAKSASGKIVKLSQLKGKTVVLEWLNHGCPFVKKHYQSKNMQRMQSKYTKRGVVWISVISSAKGKQGYSNPDKALQDKDEKGSKASYIILDPKGEIGRAYGAKVTPHMFILDKKGFVAYEGGVDDIPSTELEDIKIAKPYLAKALDSVLAGEKVKIASTKPYGCTVKY